MSYGQDPGQRVAVSYHGLVKTRSILRIISVSYRQDPGQEVAVPYHSLVKTRSIVRIISVSISLSSKVHLSLSLQCLLLYLMTV